MNHEPQKKNINSWVKKNSIRVNGNHGTSPFLLVSAPSPGKRSLATEWKTPCGWSGRVSELTEFTRCILVIWCFPQLF